MQDHFRQATSKTALLSAFRSEHHADPKRSGLRAESGRGGGASAMGTASEDEVKDWYLRRVLQEVSGNDAVAARRLGIDRSTIRRRARALGL